MRLGTAENENCVSVFGGALAFHYLCFSGLVRFSDSGKGRGFPFRAPGRTKKQIDKTMDSVRLKKIESLLTEELSDILRRWAKENKPGILVSVTRVAVTSDLSLARVRVSLFPVKDKAGLLAELREQMPVSAANWATVSGIRCARFPNWNSSTTIRSIISRPSTASCGARGRTRSENNTRLSPSGRSSPDEVCPE